LPKQGSGNFIAADVQIAFRQALTKAIQATVDENHCANDDALLPFQLVAAAWSGGVMLGPGRCDDDAYRELVRHVATHGCWPQHIDSAPLQAMLARGLGMDDIPADWPSLRRLVQSGKCVP